MNFVCRSLLLLVWLVGFSHYIFFLFIDFVYKEKVDQFLISLAFHYLDFNILLLYNGLFAFLAVFVFLYTGGSMEEPNRIWGEKCTKADIVINQGPTAPLPSGIPTYTVEIVNVCVTGCDISGIHLNCGWFSSARLINPKTFKRLRYNDCLVNDGKPLINGGTLSFQYANTFLYPLSVSRVVCS